MTYDVVWTQKFHRQAKKCLKKHLSIVNNLQELNIQLATDPTQGTPLGSNCYKIRMALSNTPQGKSSGARIITKVNNRKRQVILLSIYLKSSQNSISKEDLKSLIKEL